ncbi:MAG TPA: response regulator transcription factor [Dehalococcoidia bacterium]|nr:response regulator transcription factor [Dehalococcoidia bacterium]
MQTVVFVAQEDETLAPFLGYLNQNGYAASLSSIEVLEARGEVQPDAVVVDLATMGDNFDLAQFLEGFKAADAPPVLALLSAQQLADFHPVPGLDDFLLRTATAEEMLARLRQALARKAPAGSEDVLQYGDLVIDMANYKVYIAGRPVELTYKEYELLRFLATNRDRVYSRDALLNQVWGYDYYGGARTVDVHIRRLRSKIEDVQHTFIETVRNVGYRFRG